MFASVYHKHVFQILLGGVVLLAAVVSARGWRRGGARRPRLALVAAAVGAAGWIAAALVPPYGLERLDRDAVAADGNRIAAALEAHRARTGRYPASLSEIGVVAPQTPFGAMQYHTYVDSAGRVYYQLEVGNYGVHGFTTWWDSRSPGRGWALDT